MANKYEMQAARIETVLGAHKVPARVWQATVTPRFVRFDVTTALGTRLTKVSSLAEELAFALGARATRACTGKAACCTWKCHGTRRVRSPCWRCAAD